MTFLFKIISLKYLRYDELLHAGSPTSFNFIFLDVYLFSHKFSIQVISFSLSILQPDKKKRADYQQTLYLSKLDINHETNCLSHICSWLGQNRWWWNPVYCHTILANLNSTRIAEIYANTKLTIVESKGS